MAAPILARSTDAAQFCLTNTCYGIISELVICFRLFRHSFQYLMEVSGRRRRPEEGQSDVGELCNTCYTGFKRLSADSYCETCNHYMCSTCCKSHKVTFRGHVILSKADIPTGKTAKPKSRQITDVPFVVQNIMRELFSFFVRHITVYIVKSVRQQNTKHVKVCQYSMRRKGTKTAGHIGISCTIWLGLKAKITDLSNDINEHKSNLPTSAEAALSEVRHFRKKINDFLDKKEQQLLLATRKMESEDYKFLESLSVEVESIKNQTDNIVLNLTALEGNISDLFVTSKRSFESLKVLKREFTKCEEKNKGVQYSFKRGQAIVDFLASNATFGSIQ